MIYNGNNINLERYTEHVYNDSYSKYGKDSWQWIDEGRIFAVMDYSSSCEFTDEDMDFINREFGHDALDVIALCN